MRTRVVRREQGATSSRSRRSRVGETDEVGEEDADDLALLGRCCGWRRLERGAAGRAERYVPGHDGVARRASRPTRRRNARRKRVGGVPAPQAAQALSRHGRTSLGSPPMVPSSGPALTEALIVLAPGRSRCAGHVDHLRAPPGGGALQHERWRVGGGVSPAPSSFLDTRSRSWRSRWRGSPPPASGPRGGRGAVATRPLRDDRVFPASSTRPTSTLVRQRVSPVRGADRARPEPRSRSLRRRVARPGPGIGRDLQGGLDRGSPRRRLPWIFAEIGFYISDVPLLGGSSSPRRCALTGREPSLRAVHRGRHHGMDGVLLAMLGAPPSPRPPGAALQAATVASRPTSPSCSLWASECLPGLLDGAAAEARPTSVELPSLIRPGVSWAWAAILVAGCTHLLGALRVVRVDRRPGGRDMTRYARLALLLLVALTLGLAAAVAATAGARTELRRDHWRRRGGGGGGGTVQLAHVVGVASRRLGRSLGRLGDDRIHERLRAPARRDDGRR